MIRAQGWGGCTVHLVAEDKVDHLKSQLIDKYYRKKFPSMSEEQLQDAMVVSRPGNGSAVLETHGKQKVQVR